MDIKIWIQAARLRTLPLSISGIILGSFYAMSQSYFNWKIVFFALVTTLGFQILSNFANDYGDGLKGTDNQDRIGPKRAIQSGAITAPQMKKAMIMMVVFSLLSTLLLLYVSFGIKNIKFPLFFIILALLAIVAAIKYTVGKKAYGYSGWGDVFVFVFFGLVSVLGTYFLFVKEVDPVLFLPAIAIGFLSVAVLNLNNMRDIVSDAKAGKNTLVVKIGSGWAKIYHYFLILVALVFVLGFAILKEFRVEQYLFVLAYYPLIKHIINIYKNTELQTLDSEFKILVMGTFVLSFLVSICLIF